MAVNDLPEVGTVPSGTYISLCQAWAFRANAVTYGQTTNIVRSDKVLPVLGVAANRPGPPVIGVATQTGATTANVAFTAPADNGGASVTSYVSTSKPGNVTKSGAGSPLAVTGLTTATQYTFRVTATNVNGTSTQSGQSNQITTA